MKSFVKNKSTVLMFILFLGINVLFILKYIPRIGLSGVVASCVYISLTTTIIWIVQEIKSELLAGYTTLLVAFLMVAGMFLLYHMIDPYQLQVDRWSAIHNFHEELLRGQYPYMAQTHLGGYGSPFPIWQLFHFPFFIMGNISIAMPFSFCLTLFTLWKFVKRRKQLLLFVVFLALSPAFWYEVAVRSDLFYNFLLVFITCYYILYKQFIVEKQSRKLGVVAGLFLSTRLTIVIPFIILLFNSFSKASFKKKTSFLITALLVYVLSFIPFLYWSADSLIFFEYNPFVLQTRQGSPWGIVIIIGLSIIFSYLWKKDFLLFAKYTSMALLSLVLMVFLSRAIGDSFSNHLFSSFYDITYVNMALPFVVYFLSFKIKNRNY